MPEWEYIYYYFDSKWSVDEVVTTMRDVSGQHYFSIYNKYVQ